MKVHGHEDDINAVAFVDASSQILFSGGDDGLCKVLATVIYRNTIVDCTLDCICLNINLQTIFFSLFTVGLGSSAVG